MTAEPQSLPSSSAPEPPPATSLPIDPPSPFTPRKRVGKIPQLPKTQRDLINRLLEDGATYKTVETEMAQHGVSLNAENISNWYGGGFQDYLRHQEWLAQMAALREGASDLLQDYDPLKFHQAVNQLAVTQIFQTLRLEKLADDPVSHTRTLNALSRLSREALVFKKYEDACAQAKALALAKLDPNRDLEKERDTIFTVTERALGFPAAPAPIGPDLDEYFARNADPRSSRREEAPIKEPAPTASPDPALSPSPVPVGPLPPAGDESVSQSKIETQNSKIEEHCLECGLPLPLLLPTGGRLSYFCPHCRVELPPPGSCCEPAAEQCPGCGFNLPRLGPTGERVMDRCHHCGNTLPDPVPNPPPTAPDPPPAAVETAQAA